MIKLNELQAVVDAMTPGEWWINDIDCCIYAGDPGPDACAVGPLDDDDAEGVCQLRNAAPVLLEIVRAAMHVAGEANCNPGDECQRAAMLKLQIALEQVRWP